VETAIHVCHYAPDPCERQYSPLDASDAGLPECAIDHASRHPGRPDRRHPRRRIAAGLRSRGVGALWMDWR